MITTRNEKKIVTSQTLTSGQTTNHAKVFESPVLKDQINLIIHAGLTDMWLLLTGENIDGESLSAYRRSGLPIAIFWEQQVHMLESKPAALETLRVLGIEML